MPWYVSYTLMFGSIGGLAINAAHAVFTVITGA